MQTRSIDIYAALIEGSRECYDLKKVKKRGYNSKGIRDVGDKRRSTRKLGNKDNKRWIAHRNKCVHILYTVQI
jgi:hypothetical protein